MKVKKEPTLTWENAPDIISPELLAKIIGTGISKAREEFVKRIFLK